MDFQLSTPKQLSQYIVGLRTQAGYSQAEAGEQLGISQQTYQRIEKQPHKTSIERLMLILKLFNAALIVRVNAGVSTTVQGADSDLDTIIKEARKRPQGVHRPPTSNRKNANARPVGKVQVELKRVSGKLGNIGKVSNHAPSLHSIEKDKQLLVPPTGKDVDW